MKPLLTFAISAFFCGHSLAANNPASPIMLSGQWLPESSHQLDFARLPRVPGEHVVINDVTAKGNDSSQLDKKNGGVNQHNYLAHHDGQFWAMWSDGPGIEDRVGQRVKFATSPDGLKWSTSQFLTPVPPNSGPDSPHYATRTDKGMRHIARGFWKRDGELLALVTLDEAAGFFGKSLELRAFRFNKTSAAWEDAGVVFKNAINNFPPLRLRTGDWMMSRRTYDYSKTGVHFLVGGVKALDDWQSFPVLGTASELKAEEPDWWILPDNTLAAVFRDNRRSGFLYRAFSSDDGRTWSKPVKTNFPDATSKISGLRLSDGRYVLVSNPNPKKRDPLTLSLSEDGLVFTKMLYLVGGRHIDYPHVIEHEGSLFIAFAGGKQSVEVLKVKLSDVDAATMPDKPLIHAKATAVSTTQTSGEWMDLGSEGDRLYLSAALTVPARGQSATLSLATSTNQNRVTIGVNSTGHLTAELFDEKIHGPELKAGEKLSVLVRILSHSGKPDELFVQTGPAGSIPPEPAAVDGWTLVNQQGDSQANLSRVILTDDLAAPAFTQVRIASSHASLAQAAPVKVAIKPSAPRLDLSPPHPEKNPGSQLMLTGDWVPADTHTLDFFNLPLIPSLHAIVNDARPLEGHRVNQHNYLVHHAGRFWAMWSDGPGGSNGPNKVPHHDLADQHVAFASSADGLTWEAPGNITGKPDEGYGWIARGFWEREGKLLALASRYKAVGYAGPGLSLHAFELTSAEPTAWKPLGIVFDDTLKNFSPILLPSGEWMMNRRDGNRAVHFLRGGIKSFNDWQSTPMMSYSENGLTAEEPDWWVLPDGNLCALFRDNGGSGCLFRAFSTDEGRTWTKPVRTNFPDAKSKFSALRLKDGRYALVSNPNPKRRDPLTLAVSDDGLTFHTLGLLVSGRHIDYPHLIEHGDSLHIAFNTVKQTCEVLKVKLSDVDAIKMPSRPLVAHPAIRKSEFIYDTGPYPQIHATTIVETPTGLVSAWFGGTREKNPDVCIYVSRQIASKWTESIEVANGVQPEGTRHPTWNPVLFQPREGPLLLFYKVGPDPRTWWGELKTSTDGGKTWSAAQRLPQGIYGPIKNKPVQLANGDILCPTSNETDEKPPKWSIYFERTSDLGKTWTRTELLHDGIAISAIQPSILHLGGDRLQAMGRTREGKIFQITSEDAGKTWGEIALTDLPNPNSGTDAVTLADGRHLLIYNHTGKGRSPLNLAVSKDGQTWQDRKSVV